MQSRFRRAVRARLTGTASGRQGGQGLIEMAVATPLLLLILLGTIDLGRAYADYVALKGAVREGAGYGQLHPDDTAGMESRVIRHGVPDGTVAEASCAGSCSAFGGSATVVVAASSVFEPAALGFLSTLGLDSFTLSAEARMRVLS